jgi:hypothetical protein
MKTTYSGLQEHRIIVYTATGQKAKPKVHVWYACTVHTSPLLPHEKILRARAKLEEHIEGRRQRRTSLRQEQV